MHGIRAAWVCSGVVVALAGAGTAHATSVEVTNATLRIVDADRKANTLEIGVSTAGLEPQYDILDARSRLSPGAGCRSVVERGIVRAHHVQCGGAVGDPKIEALLVDAGGGDDLVLVSDIAVPVIALGGDGDDLLEGGTAGDALSGGAGVDTVVGGSGNDMLVGDAGDDLLEGGSGADELAGGEGNDVLRGQADSHDRLAGGENADLLDGGAGDDALRGGAGSDVLIADAGKDTASTQSGEDRVFGNANTDVKCGNPDDQVRAAGRNAPTGCSELPDDARKPQLWPPPPPDEEQPSARAAIRPRAARFSARAVQQGRAAEIRTRIRYRYKGQEFCVLITVHDRAGAQLDSFRRVVVSNGWDTRPIPATGRLRRAWKVSVTESSGCR